MIGKHIKGREFSRALRYVLTKPGAQLLGGTLLSLTPEDANLEFQSVAQESPRTQKPLLHCALSLAPGESLSNHQWRILAADYLRALGYRQNQYLLVRHTDTPSHEHVHLLVNRVGQSGKVVSDSWDYMHSQAVLHRLEAEYGLIHAPLSWEKRESNLSNSGELAGLHSAPRGLSLSPVLRARQTWEDDLRAAVNGALLLATDFTELMQHLSQRSIQTHLLKRRGRAAGIAFEWRGERIAGSRLGRAYSLPKLTAALGAKVALRSEEPEQEAIAHPEVYPFEPDETLPVAYQRYLQLEAWVQQQTGQRCTRRQIDLHIAQWALRSTRPEEARALVYSPEIHRLRSEQGEAVALEYLKALMEEAQRQAVSFFDLQRQDAHER